ncbi:hypothetical protein PVAND_005638 [Polypedilum vanderplanki]|uniref:Uracil-DNA glycosylase-like domain-containing protein n=1 Tax=Polypedilum vanderplanki TaxID=319348 RepID=A0A9J6C0M5_POLVA|nr:hypothetical protein PVAND_005638 [Polypedilum vanderplanki]
MNRQHSEDLENDEENNEEQQDKEDILRKLSVDITFEKSFWEKIDAIENELVSELLEIDFLKDNNVDAVYNPLDYAADIHINYLKKFLKQSPSVLFLGMNPGLLGMCQTGVPFGNVSSVKNWMKLSGKVEKPKIEIKMKPIEGLECKKEEQSGKRFWGLMEELCGEPENFFRHCFVYNLCPLAFLSKTGRNITPTELKGECKNALNTVCLNYLSKIINTLKPKVIITVGSYAEQKIKDLKKKNLISESIECKLLPHPSPRALNNNDWVEKARKWMRENDMLKYFKTEQS